MRIGSTFLFLLLCCLHIPVAAAVESITVDAVAPMQRLGDTADVLEDPEGLFTLADASSQANADRYYKRSTRFGATIAAHWTRLVFYNASKQPLTRWLDTSNRTFTELDVYAPDETGHIIHLTAGARRPFAERPIHTAEFVFPLHLAPQQATVVYLRSRMSATSNANMTLRIWQPEAYRQHADSERVQWLLYSGILAALAVINLLLWIYLRDPHYFRYVVLQIGMYLVVSFGNGMGGYGAGFELLVSDAPLLHVVLWPISLAGGASASVYFLAPLLGLQRITPRLYRIILFCIALSWTVATLRAVGNVVFVPAFVSVVQKAAPLLMLGAGGAMVLLVLAALFAVRERVSYARYVLAAYTVFLLISLSTAIAFAFGGVRDAQSSAVLWASLAEMTIMAMALADRFYAERAAKIAAQAAVIDTLRASENELEAKVAERTDQLAASEARTRELLHNILPAAVAAELAEHGQAHPVELKSASILFTDFADFTQAASTMPGERMVAELNDIFSAFDDICRTHGIEKIKTIGDAYMAAAGVPLPCADHAQRAARAGLAMCAFVAERNQAAAFKWKLRVGIHSGPVVAGVVGKHKYAFDIWGDSVNMASRMESSGEAGKVNVSAYTYDLIRNDFACEYRGKVSAKGKGEVDMYFVVGKTA